MKRKVIALLMASILALGLAACGGSAATAEKTEEKATEEAAKEEVKEEEPAVEEPAEEAPAEEAAEEAPAEEAAEEHEPVTVSLWYFDVVGAEPFYDELADKVHEKYPWIELDIDVLPGDTGPEKFTVACATNTTPDVYIDGYSRIAPAVFADLTIDLTDVYDAHKDIFFADQKEGVKDGQKRFIAYYSGAPYCMVVNMDLAEKLGVTDMLPADWETWSYDQFLDLCRAAKAADSSIYPVSLYGGSRSGDAWDYSFMLGNGATLLNDDHTATSVNADGNKEKIIEVLEMYQTLVNEGLVPDGVASLSDDDVNELFWSGQLLFLPTGYNYVSWTYTLQQEGTAVPFEMNAVALPTPAGDGPPQTASWGASGVCGFSNNGHEEEAKLVIDTILSDLEFRQGIISAAGSLPLTNDIEMEYETPEITAIMARAIEYGAEHADSSFGILEPFWSDFRETFYVLKQDLFVGNITPEQFVEKWAETGDKAISDYLTAN